MSHHEHRICARLPCFLTALRHPPEVFPKRGLPHLCRRGIVHQFFIAGNCTSRDWVHHGIGVMLKVDGHFGMLQERARCVHRTERGLFLQGE